MSSTGCSVHIWPVAFWLIGTPIVAFTACVTQMSLQVPKEQPPFLYLESEPGEATIHLNGHESGLLTPSLARPKIKRGAESEFTIAVQHGEVVARAKLATPGVHQFGLHSWERLSYQRLTPDLDGCLWVARSRDATRVWFPEAGRIRCGIGLFSYDRTFYLDDSFVEPFEWGPDSSRSFGVTLGLDLAAGSHDLAGAEWNARVNLHDRTTVYFDEADQNVGAMKGLLVIELSAAMFPKRTLEISEAAPLTIAGDEPQPFELSAGTLLFSDSSGRENRIEVVLNDGQGLWIRAGTSLDP